MKLQLFISHNGGVSRRKAFDHVINGDVTVNGMVIREPSHMCEAGEDKVTLLGREIKLTDYQYIMLHKPVGYVTTCEAQFDQWMVMSLMPSDLRHLKPVGRLDKDTQGLLLLTNDGELANRLAHPSFDVNKTYHVRVVRKMEFREKNRLEEGVLIDKFRTAPAQVANMTFGEGYTEFDLTIHEGHKHQVRLMCHEVGHDVQKLTRVAQGPLQLGDLKSGAWRALTDEELAKLHEIGRTKIAPVFKSHSPQRRYSSNRDWSSDPSVAQRREPRERTSSGGGRERLRGDRPYSSAPRASRPSGDRPYSSAPREGRPSGERREYKPQGRDARPHSDRPRSDRPYSSAPRGDRPHSSAPREGRPSGERREYKPQDRDARPHSDRPRSDRPYSSAPRGDRPYSRAPREGRSSDRRDSKPYGSPATGPRAFGARKPFAKKPFGNKPYNKKPFSR
ncbi:MAG: pseudouridine synthase [Candidatus Omnitrophota bacterium]